MSDTPRTDEKEDIGDCFLRAVDSDFSRQLERELNAANERIKQIEAEKANLRETLLHRDGWIVLLLAAGDDLCATSNNTEQRLKWNTAKQC